MSAEVLAEARRLHARKETNGRAVDQADYAKLLEQVDANSVDADFIASSLIALDLTPDQFEADLQLYRHRKRLIALKSRTAEIADARRDANEKLAAAQIAHKEAIATADAALRQARAVSSTVEREHERASTALDQLRNSLPAWLRDRIEEAQTDLRNLIDQSPWSHGDGLDNWLATTARDEHAAIQHRLAVLDRHVEQSCNQAWPLPLTAEELDAIEAELAAVPPAPEPEATGEGDDLGDDLDADLDNESAELDGDDNFEGIDGSLELPPMEPATEPLAETEATTPRRGRRRAHSERTAMAAGSYDPSTVDD